MAGLVLVGLILAGAVPTVTARADDGLTDRQREIVLTVLDGRGFITRDLHAVFWSEVPAALREDAEARAAFVQRVEQANTATLRFQREVWRSVQKSLKAKRVVKTADYAAAKAAAPDVLAWVDDPRLRLAVGIAEQLLERAAYGHRIVRMPGRTIYISSRWTRHVLSKLDAAFARIDHLLQPEWRPVVREYRYPEAHIAVLSDTPFAVLHDSGRYGYGYLGDVIDLSKRLSGTDAVGIMVTHHDHTWADLADPASRLAGSFLAIASFMGAGPTESMGARPAEPEVLSSPWRSRNAASGSGTFFNAWRGESPGIFPEGPFHLSVRAVALPEHEGALVLWARSGLSIEDADRLRGQLEQSTEILP